MGDILKLKPDIIVGNYILCEACGTPIPHMELTYFAPMYIHGGYHIVCPVCADRIMGGLTGELSTQILEEFLEWWYERTNQELKYIQAVIRFWHYREV